MSFGNDSYRCDLPPYFPPKLGIPSAVNYIQACVAISTGLIGFLLNLFVLFMIIKHKKLHVRLMYIALQIIAVDLLYTLTIPPTIFTSGILEDWIFGHTICSIVGIIHDFFAMFRFTVTTTLATDRFASVFFPFFYSRNSSVLIILQLVMVYILSLLRALLPLTGILDCYVYIPTQKTCTAFSGCSDRCFWFVICSTTIIFLFGILLPFLLYFSLYCKIKCLQRKMTTVVGSSGPSQSHGTVKDIHCSSEDTSSSTIPSSIHVTTISTTAIPATSTPVTSVTAIIPTTSTTTIPVTSTSTPPTSTTTLTTTTSTATPAASTTPTSTTTPTTTDHLTLPKKLIHFTNDSFQESDATELEFNKIKHITMDVPVATVTNYRSNKRIHITMFILLLSVLGCSLPAFTLYVFQFIYIREPKAVLFVMNMLVGRSFFNLLPIVDSIAIMRHQEFRTACVKLGKFIRKKVFLY